MRFTFRHFLLTLLLAIGANAYAQKTYYVAGNKALTGSDWKIEEKNKLTFISDTIGTITYDVTPGILALKVTDGGSEWWGRKDGKNVVQTMYKNTSLTIEFNVRTKEITLKGDGVDDWKNNKEIFLSGSGALTGFAWGVHEELKLTFGADSVGSITLKDIRPGTYPFKITDRQHWWGSDDGGNLYVTVDETCDVTILYDGYTHKITCKGDHLGIHKLITDQMYLPGTLIGNWEVNGDTRMDSHGNGLFSILAKNVKPGTYQVKFTTNEDWVDSWGTMSRSTADTKYDATFEGFNIDIKLTKTSDVEIFFDISKYNTETQDGAIYWYTVK